jgi:hypothetical protein
MYPSEFASLFPPFPKKNKVFVAMAFEDRFNARWNDVIAPAISSVMVDGESLEPFRSDTRYVSDSVLTEILEGITTHLLVFADITTIGSMDGRPVRNGNVMYEVGLAHALRLPEEVLLYRSDHERLLFDVANVRVNHYEPDIDAKSARESIANAIANSINELDLKRHLAVRSAAKSLDYEGWTILGQAAAEGGIHHPRTRTMGNVLAASTKSPAIRGLLSMGALQTSYLKLTPELLSGGDDTEAEQLLRYEVTPYGGAILEYAAEEMGLMSRENWRILEERFRRNAAKENPSAS